ncbi:MAG TPA: zinc ribbon domain-containing protein [Tepidisphaeraceae bacterium]|jgi:putative FmdB family regulatory protein|nr:zinc ribbon domain-containing protein [Tepidisphaeraceae bacterium]
MPIYEYTCDACKKTFDHLARTMTASAPVKCPECGSNQTQRALSVFAVGAESASTSRTPLPMQGGCGRCGGPGPCASGF